MYHPHALEGEVQVTSVQPRQGVENSLGPPKNEGGAAHLPHNSRAGNALRNPTSRKSAAWGPVGPQTPAYQRTALPKPPRDTACAGASSTAVARADPQTPGDQVKTPSHAICGCSPRWGLLCWCGAGRSSDTRGPGNDESQTVCACCLRWALLNRRGAGRSRKTRGPGNDHPKAFADALCSGASLTDAGPAGPHSQGTRYRPSSKAPAAGTFAGAPGPTCPGGASPQTLEDRKMSYTRRCSSLRAMEH